MIHSNTNDKVTTLTLSRPPVNAISEEWVRMFERKLDDFAKGPPCTVLHIRSNQKVFCAGADLNEVRARMEAPDGAERMYAYVAGIQRLYARIEQLPQVTVAEIGGAAMGGGLDRTLTQAVTGCNLIIGEHRGIKADQPSQVVEQSPATGVFRIGLDLGQRPI